MNRSLGETSESAHSKKTRIETNILWLWKKLHRKVKAPIPRKQGLKLSYCSPVRRIKASESAHSKKTRIETQLLAAYKLHSILWKRPFQENKDWNDFESDLNDLQPCLWKRPFQENKDWNSHILAYLFTTFNRESAHSKKTRIETRLYKPRSQAYPILWKRPFQENKDWNFISLIIRDISDEVKAPIPRKQGLKHSLSWCWFSVRKSSESAHSKKTRIETYKQRPNCCRELQWKRPFQENKDWNIFSINSKMTFSPCESAHSKKTRIETLL